MGNTGFRTTSVMVWDIEKGTKQQSRTICMAKAILVLEDWHYDRSIYDNHHIKQQKMVLFIIL